jgi:copper chaperone CopZ
MKKLILIITITLLPFITVAQIQKVTLQARGLTCSMCSNSVYKSLSAVAFVKKVETDVETSTFEISFKEGQDIEIDALQKAVVKAGFSVSNLTVTMNVDHLKISGQSSALIGGKEFHFINAKDIVLNGQIKLRIVDKDFLSAKEFKKVKDKLSADMGKRIYNVTVSNS